MTAGPGAAWAGRREWIVLATLLLPEFRDPEPRRLDPGSAALSLAAVLAFIYGLKQLAEGDGRRRPGSSQAPC